VAQRLRVGIVGYGTVARAHLAAYRELSAVEVVSIAETNTTRLGQVRRELGIAGYTTLEEMLGAAHPDLVCVLTPPSSHEELVKRCAAAHVHVLCEKPMALSVEACESMIHACRASSVRLCYGASYRYLPALMRAREMILAGELGQVLLLREYAVGGIASAERGTLPFTHYPKGGPGGSGMGLCDHGIHLLDVFPWLMDSHTTGVWGRGNISGEPQRPEYVHLEYANGAIGELLYEDGTYTTTLPDEGQFAWSAGWSVGGSPRAEPPAGSWQADPGCIHIHGTEGSLRIFHYANVMFHRTHDFVREVRVADRPMPGNFALQLEAFIQAIEFGAPTPVPGEVGLEAARTLLGVYARTGKPVDTSLDPPGPRAHP
jgi:UDP-N-acetyl-2-amino-2-deoxyglucuronate dehydrogenase